MASSMKELRFRPSLRALSSRICRPSGVMRMVRFFLFIVCSIGLVLAQCYSVLASVWPPCGRILESLCSSAGGCHGLETDNVGFHTSPHFRHLHLLGGKKRGMSKSNHVRNVHRRPRRMMVELRLPHLGHVGASISPCESEGEGSGWKASALVAASTNFSGT